MQANICDKNEGFESENEYEWELNMREEMKYFNETERLSENVCRK